MTLTDHEKKLVLNLIGIAWNSGAIRSPEGAVEVEHLRSRLVEQKEETTKA